ncbi:hypothetical protein [Fructilactobacillus fructivorans]|nr:hypothetical protein [Fructilactobacillus fructivorans]
MKSEWTVVGSDDLIDQSDSLVPPAILIVISRLVGLPDQPL